jgi:hypothetical protein
MTAVFETPNFAAVFSQAVFASLVIRVLVCIVSFLGRPTLLLFETAVLMPQIIQQNALKNNSKRLVITHYVV